MKLDLTGKKFVSSCEVCKFIFSDMNKIKSITDDIKEYYVKEFENIGVSKL